MHRIGNTRQPFITKASQNQFKNSEVNPIAFKLIELQLTRFLIQIVQKSANVSYINPITRIENSNKNNHNNHREVREQLLIPGAAEEAPPSMAVAPPKRIRRGPKDLVAATAVRVWPHRGPGASSSVSQ